MSFEGRQDLPGHKLNGLMTEYSAAELDHLIAAADKVTQQEPHNNFVRMRARVSA